MPDARVPDPDVSVERSCWSTSTLDCSESKFVESCLIMAASSAMVGSAMGGGGCGAVEFCGGLGSGAGGMEGFGDGVIDEERLEVDTRLSRA